MFYYFYFKPHRRTGVPSVDRSSGLGSLSESERFISSDTRFHPPSISPHRGGRPYYPLSQQDHRTTSECESLKNMEKQCNEKLNEQRLKYDQLLGELTSDLELLTQQMVHEKSENEDHSKPLEETIYELEQQNDRLQRSLVDHERKVNGHLKEISLESGQLKRKLADLEYQLRTKESTIEELKCSEATLDAELKLQKQICKCHYEKMENQDALSVRLQEMHQLLNEKSAECVRTATALRWKNIEVERVEKLTGEEKKRLRDEIDEQMKVLSVTRNRLMDVERSVENKCMEVTKLNQMLKDSEERECQLQDSLMRSKEQLSSLESQVFK